MERGLLGFRNVTTLGFALALFLTITTATFIMFYNEQPLAYMDEVFHVVQARHYCAGNFHSWNSKITTPPALYILSELLLIPITVISGRSLHQVCSIFNLRFVNVLFAIGNFCLIYLLFHKLSGIDKVKVSQKFILATVNVSILPVLYFFTFLYYTDAGSLFFVLLTYLFHSQHQEYLAAFAGFIAVTFRQTNVIWVFFVAAETALSIVKKYVKKLDHRTQHSVYQLVEIIQLLGTLLFQQRSQFYLLLSQICTACFGYICVGLVFITFVVLNNGIVLGDRTAHEACFHLPQLFYFVGFCMFFSVTSFITKSNVKRFLKFAKSNVIIICIEGAFIFTGILYFTHVHKYLLADNRHLTFYIWKRILGRSDGLNYVFIPAYIYSAWVMNDMLFHKDFMWKMIFWVCIIASVVPQKLFELRYFIIPYIIFRLNSPVAGYRQLILECLLYSLINLFTLYQFMYRTFKWTEYDKQRIMW